MQTLTYSSNEDSQLNNARRDYWSSCYMLGESNRDPRYDKALWLRAIPQKRRNLVDVAKRYRARLNQRRIYKVPLIGETGGVSFYQVVTACSPANAQFKADRLVHGCFITGEPIDMGAA